MRKAKKEKAPSDSLPSTTTELHAVAGRQQTKGSRRSSSPRSGIRVRQRARAQGERKLESPEPLPAGDRAAKYQAMYSAACSASSLGQIELDAQRFAQSLADEGLSSLTEQELYQLALLAAAEGQPSLPEEDVVAVLLEAS